MKRMIKNELISFNLNNFEKDKLCFKSILIKKSLKSVERNTNLLDLAHSDICELNGMLIGGEIDISLHLLMIVLHILMYIY